MDYRDLYEEADECRRKAMSFKGGPEAPFLFRLAGEFERLATERFMPNRRANPPLDR